MIIFLTAFAGALILFPILSTMMESCYFKYRWTITPISVFLLAVVASIFLYLHGLLPNYSDGTREGYIVKVSNKGFICKTVEAEMQTGTGNMAALSDPFDFTIIDKNLIAKLSEYQGKKVRLHYNAYLMRQACKSDTGVIVDKIDLVKE